MDGIITDIQRFCLHDGPGIRTTVFFKGCNLDCAWCHNPETIAFEPEIMIDSQKCIACGYCEDDCFSGARRTVGKPYTVNELMAEIEQDRSYYGAEGGITLTGGELACQADFACAVLKQCRQTGIGRVIETNLCYDKAVLNTLAPLCDIVMCDLKIWDDETHKKWLGLSNQIVKENLMHLSDLAVPFAVRTAIIPGVNENPEDIKSIAGFLAALPHLLFYELLSYNPLGLSKELEGKQLRSTFKTLPKEDMLNLAKLAAKSGIPVRLDGFHGLYER